MDTNDMRTVWRINLQTVLITEIKKIIPIQNTPIRLTDKEQEKDLCYHIADIFADVGLIKRYHEVTYVFNGCFYEPLINTDNLKNFTYAVVYNSGVILSEKKCRLVIAETILRTPDYNGIPNDERYTLFQNGYVNNMTGELTNYVPDYFPTMCVEANYFFNFPTSLSSPFVLCPYHPIMNMFLDSISGGDPVLIKRFWEMTGYCISSDGRAKRIFLFIGESGDNGKSTYLNLLSSLISWQGIAGMSITNLAGGRFALSELSNKRLEISADEGVLNLNTANIAQLKSISGHDLIMADVKHGQQIRFVSTCKILIASNHNIGAAYTAHDPAFAIRICSLPFDVRIPKEQQDPFLIQKLLAEKDVIVTEAFLHYMELRNRNYIFTGDDIYDNHINMYPNTPDYMTITEFTNECCCLSPETFTYTEDLYQAFIIRYGTVFKDITAFSQAFYRVNKNFLTKSRKHIGNRNAWGFYGVTLKSLKEVDL